MELAIADEYGLVSLWCQYKGILKDGGMKFWVHNGHWEGVFYPQSNHFCVGRTQKYHPGRLVWQGEAPFGEDDYQAAMAWIQKKVDRNGGVMRDYIFINSPKSKKRYAGPDPEEDKEIPF